MMPPLRPYQLEPLRAIWRSVRDRAGLSFSVMMARQAGKNELSAQLEVRLLLRFAPFGGDGIKASPTFRPQTLNSLDRLKARLDDAGLGGLWRAERGYIVRLGRARMVFLSAEPSAQVVGHTAGLILEVDEAQDVLPEKFDKDFRPMGAAANATTVYYGTPWDGDSLLEQVKVRHLELERRDGIRRHFEYDWETVARYNPAYGLYVRAERERLGEAHPLFQTQYALRPVAALSRTFDGADLRLLAGEHPRLTGPAAGEHYVIGLDLAGQAWDGAGGLGGWDPTGRRDSTVLTVGRVRPGNFGPVLEIVHHEVFTGLRHDILVPRLVEVIRRWRPEAVAADATGLGQPVVGLLGAEFGRRVLPVVFTAARKTGLAAELIAAVKAGRLRVYADPSAERAEFLRQFGLARTRARPGGYLEVAVDPAEGHDDFLISAALALEAAGQVRPRRARGYPAAEAGT